MSEELLKKLLEKNRRSRDLAASQIQRLSAVMQTGTIQEYTQAVTEILYESSGQDKRSGDQVLGPDGETQPVDGDSGGGTD